MVTIEQAYSDTSMALDSGGAFDTAKIVYKVFDAADEKEALLAVYNSAGKTFEGLSLDTVEMDERLTGTAWKIVANYKGSSDTPDSADDGEETYSFEIGGGTTRVTQSLDTVSYSSGESESAPDLGHAIEWDGEKANGVDIYVPTFNFHIAKWFNVSQLDTQLQKNIASVAGKVNKNPFRGFARGEVLFIGAVGQWKKSDTVTEITFHFAVSENKEGYDVGEIRIAQKFGWWYQWVQLSKKADEESKSILPQVDAVYLEQVYNEIDFRKLGID